MRKNNQQKPLARWIAASLAAGAMAGFGAQAVAATAAGTIIKNLATVTYQDANGNEYSAQSNEAFVTVAEVFSATIENDKALTAAPGQTVYFPHVLTNTGNATDTYTISTDTLVPGVVIYNDLNGNGQPDPGEPVVAKGDTATTAATTGTVTIAAGDQVNLVVAMPIPVTAKDTDAPYTAKLVATNASDTVVDLDGLVDAADTEEGTVVDTATVTTDPVLVLGKQSVLNAANNTITYTLTVKNNGGSAATNVKILDALPETVGFDDAGLPVTASVAVVSVDTSGLVNAGDVEGAYDGGYAETDTDVNLNGNMTDTLEAIVATDVSLPPNTTVSVTYTVKYDLDEAGTDPDWKTWEAGTEVENTFVVTSDETGAVSSNTTHDVLPQYYAVDADDDGRAGFDNGGVGNDGVDDDELPTNDVQYVDSVPTGAEVLYTHTITNNGNGEDAFNLTVTNTDFPSGTIFTFWDSTNAVQITDTDNDGVPDTGTIAAGGTQTIVIRAKLPAGIDGNTGFTAVLTATSANKDKDSDADDDSNETTLSLGAITPAAIDIISEHSNPSKPNITGDEGTFDTIEDFTVTGFNDDGSANAQATGIAAVADTVVGGSVTFDLQLANESGSPDSYLLSAENVPAGWDVVFKDLDGNVISTSPLISGINPDDATLNVFKYQAVVTISADPTLAKSESDQTDAVDANNDTDKDYFIDFIAASTGTTGLKDTVTNAIDVAPLREVVITPNGQNQIQPGGTVDYNHLLENNGNLPETLDLDVSNTQAPSGWTTIISVDHDGLDTTPMVALNTLAAGTLIPAGLDSDGNVIEVEVQSDGSLLLPAGADLAINTTVNAPSNAPQGTVDLSTITVTDVSIDPDTLVEAGTVMDTAEDQTNVILGQVRLEKKAAIDVGCDGNLETTFSTNQTTKVEPGDCVTWQLTATNEGNATVNNVVISDAAPAFTDLLSDSATLKFCEVNGCDPIADNTAVVGTNSFMDASTGIVKFIPLDGELESGETATGQFTVKVQ